MAILLRFAMFLLALPALSESRAFRGHVTEGSMTQEELRARVLEDVLSALGHSNRVTEARLEALEKAVRPMFLSMPKNEFGNLGHAAARYVLHRLFVQRHAMYIKGLEPAGAARNATDSAAAVLQDRVPSFVQSLFEQRLDGRGLGLHEVSVLAATLEHLVHDEALKRLERAYDLVGVSQETRHDPGALERVLDAYLALFLAGQGNSSSFDQSFQEVVLSYPGWHETQKFARQVQVAVTTSRAAEADFAGGTLTFAGMGAVVEEIGERYGRWQDAECKDMKAMLIKMDSGGNGRVPLSGFYAAGLSGNWQFTESVEYLRELGALDEASAEAAVLIPNYVNAHSNCLASSSMFSVCCINECEALLGHLEAEIAQPEAETTRILEIVESLPSASVRAPRRLDDALRQRLEEVATYHGGQVPLHGRLFAQWLHHAYPRECPYPHVAGRTSPRTADEWLQETGQLASAKREDMERLVQDFQRTRGEVDVNASAAHPWTFEEELVVETRKRFPVTSRFLWAFLLAAAAFARQVWSLRGLWRGGCSSLLPLAQKQHAC